jgi:sarcosine oxidase
VASACDTIVIGLGAMGSAVACHLARRGRSVLGFDRYAPPHVFGSSHGETRIIREAYFEHPVYVPLVQRAYALWRELEVASGATLYHQTGGLMIGHRESDLVTGALSSAREHGLAHEVLDLAALAARFPMLQPEDGMVAVLEPRAGVLYPEACVRAHLALARRAGAELHCDEPVAGWSAERDRVRVHTARGEYSARHLVVTAGAWVTTLFPDLALPFAVERQTLHWFRPRDRDGAFDAAHCPIHLWQFDGRQFFYGFPDLGDGVKVARHHCGQVTTADTVLRDVDAAEIDDIRALVQRFVPRAGVDWLRGTVCLYTNTPDEHFWIDAHPAHPQVQIVSPCSGHGFKFAPVIGEIVADLVEDRAPRFDLGLFRARLATRKEA